MKSRRAGHCQRAAWVGLCFVFGLAFVIASGGVVNAQAYIFDSLSPEDQVRMFEAMEASDMAEREERWDDALELYREMQSILPLEEYSYRQAYCLEQISRYVDALDIYYALADSADDEIARSSSARVRVLEDLVANLPALLHLRTERLLATAVLDDEPLGSVSPDGVIFEVEPGEHTVVVTLDGYEQFTEIVTLVPGREVVVEVRLLESALIGEPGDDDQTAALDRDPDSARDTDTDEEPVQTSRNLTATWILVGVAVAAGGTGLVFGLVSNSKSDEADSLDRSDPNVSRAQADALTDDAQSFARAANISFGIAGAAAIAAVVAFLLAPTEPASATRDSAAVWRIEPLWLPNGGGAGFSFEF